MDLISFECAARGSRRRRSHPVRPSAARDDTCRRHSAARNPRPAGARPSGAGLAWWLRALLIAELIAASAFLLFTALRIPLQITRSELSATLVPDALLVFLIVIAIDGFDRRSVTREQRWLMAWVARPSVILMMLALIVNAMMPLPPAVDTPNAGVVVSSGPDVLSGVFSIGWAVALLAFVMSLNLVCVIALSRLSRHARS